MTHHEYEDLFPGEGVWRDPSDDGERMGFYALSSACAVGSAVGAGLLIVHSFGNREEFWPYFLMGLASVAISGFFTFWLVKEARQWAWDRITFDKIVAGIILIGIGLFAVLFPGMAESPITFPAVAAVTGGLVLFGLLLGLFGALAEKIALRRRLLGWALVVERYALTDDLSRIEDAVCPHDDGYTAIVVLRFVGRRPRKFLCSRFAYEMCCPGRVGMAFGNAHQIAEFKT